MQSVQTTDIVARWGGEEFLIILGKCEPSDVVTLAERIRKRVEVSVWDFRESGNQSPLAVPSARPKRTVIKRSQSPTKRSTWASEMDAIVSLSTHAQTSRPPPLSSIPMSAKSLWK